MSQAKPFTIFLAGVTEDGSQWSCELTLTPIGSLSMNLDLSSTHLSDNFIVHVSRATNLGVVLASLQSGLLNGPRR